MADDKTAQKLLKQREELLNARANFDSTFEDIATYIRLERQGFITKKTEGEERTDLLYDSTAPLANTRLASNMRGMLTDTNTKWFFLRTGDEDLDSNDDVVEWLDTCSERMRRAIYVSNFTNKADEFYLDLGSFGTAAMYIEEGRTSILNFKTCNLADIVFTEDNEGEKDAVYMTYTYTAIQAVKKFGYDNVSKEIREALANTPQKTFDFVHVVMRRENAILTKLDNKNMKFASYWIDVKEKYTVLESGYPEMPYVIARWRKMSGTSWGFGPGQMAIPSIRILNEREKLNLVLERKYSNPPMWGVEGSTEGPLYTGAGRVNWGRSMGEQPQPMLTINPAGMDWSEAKKREYRELIYDIFFVNQLYLIDRPNMTAAEVMQRTRDNMAIMGPTYERIVNEFLSPLITREFGIMFRAGQFPQPPEELRGRMLDVRYESPLARANRGQQIDSIIAATQSLGMLAQVKGPDVLDWIPGDDWAKDIIEQNGLEKSRDDDVAGIREARMQAAQQAMMQEAVQSGVATAAEASKITQPAAM